MKLKWKTIIIPLALLLSCDRNDALPEENLAGEEVFHGMIELGEKLNDPYTVENIRAALANVDPTKSDRVEITATDLYVRFLPKSEEEFERVKATGAYLLDHPVDYRIVREGDYYHDPSLSDDKITWQYAVVPKDFVFPEGVRYELLDECYLSENDAVTRAEFGDVDWDAVEREAFRLSGNEDLYVPPTKAGKQTPKGRITIEDAAWSGGKPFGLAGVRVSCNCFVKFAHCYTDRDGYYEMPKQFSAKPRYRLVFDNTEGFSIGFNLILVPGSVSTMGTGEPGGIDYHITPESDETIWTRSVVNNAAYDYISRCNESDLNILAPPKNLRIWIFKKLDCSSCVMMRQGAMVENELISQYLGEYALLIKLFLPDITIGTKGREGYAGIYSATVHELSHSSHYAQVGNGYWNPYIRYIISAYLKEGREAYGTGTLKDAGYCEVGEMWGYFMESVLYKDRYGGAVPAFGTSFWFYPQIFRYLYDRGMTCSEIYKALKSNVTGRDDLLSELIHLYPERESMLRQVFERYSRQ